MQPLASDDYTADEVRSQLHSGARRVTFAYELLDDSNVLQGELTEVEGASVKNSTSAEIKRTARFSLGDGDQIDFGSERIRPVLILSMPTLVIDIDDEERDFATGTHSGTTATATGLQLANP